MQIVGTLDLVPDGLASVRFILASLRAEGVPFAACSAVFRPPGDLS
jgi:hypothetical protein